MWLAADGQSSASEPRTIIETLDSLARVAARQLCAAELQSDSPDISLQHHAASWLVAARMTEVCPKIRLKISAENSSPKQAATLGITAFGVRYERLAETDDSLRRICTVSLAGTYPLPSGELMPFPPAFARHIDVIAEGDVTAAEAGGYDFSRGAVPPRPGGFMSDILEPLVIVSTAALTVLLLFSVRSQ